MKYLIWILFLVSSCQKKDEANKESENTACLLIYRLYPQDLYLYPADLGSECSAYKIELGPDNFEKLHFSEQSFYGKENENKIYLKEIVVDDLNKKIIYELLVHEFNSVNEPNSSNIVKVRKVEINYLNTPNIENELYSKFKEMNYCIYTSINSENGVAIQKNLETKPNKFSSESISILPSAMLSLTLLDQTVFVIGDFSENTFCSRRDVDRISNFFKYLYLFSDNKVILSEELVENLTY